MLYFEAVGAGIAVAKNPDKVFGGFAKCCGCCKKCCNLCPCLKPLTDALEMKLMVFAGAIYGRCLGTFSIENLLAKTQHLASALVTILVIRKKKIPQLTGQLTPPPSTKKNERS